MYECEGLRTEDVVMMLCKALWDKLFVKVGYKNKIALPGGINMAASWTHASTVAPYELTANPTVNILNAHK